MVGVATETVSGKEKRLIGEEIEFKKRRREREISGIQKTKRGGRNAYKKGGEDK